MTDTVLNDVLQCAVVTIWLPCFVNTAMLRALLQQNLMFSLWFFYFVPELCNGYSRACRAASRLSLHLWQFQVRVSFGSCRGLVWDTREKLFSPGRQSALQLSFLSHGGVVADADTEHNVELRVIPMNSVLLGTRGSVRESVGKGDSLSSKHITINF